MKTFLITFFIAFPIIFSIFFLACRITCCYILPRQPKLTKTMQTNKLRKLIQSTKGKFFSCTFVKKDGTIRLANGKDKYTRLLVGGRSTLEGTEYTSFVDRNKDSWIAASDERLREFKCGKIHEIF